MASAATETKIRRGLYPKWGHTAGHNNHLGRSLRDSAAEKSPSRLPSVTCEPCSAGGAQEANTLTKGPSISSEPNPLGCLDLDQGLFTCPPRAGAPYDPQSFPWHTHPRRGGRCRRTSPASSLTGTRESYTCYKTNSYSPAHSDPPDRKLSLGQSFNHRETPTVH